MEEQQAFGKMSRITQLVYETMPNYEIAGYVMFLIIFSISVLVFKLGFARKLPLLQNLVIYVFLFLGCLVLQFLSIALPIAEGLIVAALILIIYKIRLRLEKKQSSAT